MIDPSGYGPLSPAATRLVDCLEALTSETGHEAACAIFTEIPAYRASRDERFFADVAHHVEHNIEALVTSLRRGSAPDAAELTFLRAPTTRRAQRSIALSEFLHAFRIGLRHIWRTLVSGAHDDEHRAEALKLVDPVAEYINIASTRVTEVYVEVEKLLLADGERVRRDALENLLAAEIVRPGAQSDALAAAGISQDSTLIVLSALSSAETEMTRIRGAATAIGQVAGRLTTPLALQRGDEIVAVLPVDEAGGAKLDDALKTFHRQMLDEQLPLRIGVSTVVRGPVSVHAAYREALDARSMTSLDTPVICFCAMTAFDYLTRTGDETVRRMVPRAVASFVEQDVRAGGVLTHTLLAYAEANLNVKVTAERLHVHVNTAHSRLARISERTGSDRRSLSGVIDLLIAVKLAAATSATRKP